MMGCFCGGKYGIPYPAPLSLSLLLQHVVTIQKLESVTSHKGSSTVMYIYKVCIDKIITG